MNESLSLWSRKLAQHPLPLLPWLGELNSKHLPPPTQQFKFNYSLVCMMHISLKGDTFFSWTIKSCPWSRAL